MESLIISCLGFLAMHWIISGSPVRNFFVKKLGEILFKSIFALIITGLLTWMTLAYIHAPYIETWGQAGNLKPVASVLIFMAFILLPMSITNKNPTTLGLVRPGQVTARGIVRITRHAGLIGLGLWGLAHFLVNGDWASHWLFGTIAFEGLIGPVNLDRKYRARYGEAWSAFAAQTSHIPFVAILSGRNKLVLGELNIWAAGSGAILFVLVAYNHEHWFGVPI